MLDFGNKGSIHLNIYQLSLLIVLALCKMYYLCPMNKPKIAIIHPNSLCCMAMRTILTDIAPFVSMFQMVEIASYNSMEEFMEDNPHSAIHYFISNSILNLNSEFFTPQARRCIVLCDGEEQVPKGFRTIDLRSPERELIKLLLSIHSSAHMAHGMEHQIPTQTGEQLSEREKEVLALSVKGYINKEIADKLNISTATVIFHRRNIGEKIGSKSIGRQTIYAVMNGIVDYREL